MSGAQVDFERLYERLDAAERALEEAEAAAEQRRAEILTERAQAIGLARRQIEPGTLTVMAFTVAGGRYAVPFDRLDQVVECAGLCVLPKVPAAVLGALVVRTGIVAVLDLKVLLGLAERDLSDLRVVLVLKDGGERFGLAVEATEGALELPVKALRPAPPGPYTGLADDGLLVLDVPRLGHAAA